MENLLATDRIIEPAIQRRRIIKNSVVGSLVIIIVGGGFTWGIGWLAPSVKRERIRTARVEIGSVEATITGSGTVVPEFERVITSPINTRVQRDLHRPGVTLSEGERIIELDLAPITLNLRKNQDQIDLNRNQQQQLRLDREKTRNELKKNLEIKKLTVERNQSRTIRQRKLFEMGSVAEDEVLEHELTEKISVIELEDLTTSLENTNESTIADLEELAIQLNTLQLERLELQRQLEQAEPKADRTGVLTWVVSQEGTNVLQGSVVARIADLTSFRVDATVSDIHASRVQVGLPVKVEIHEEVLTGFISNILPTIENGIMTLEVRLNENRHPELRSNLRVEAYVIIAHKDQALRIKRGPFIPGEGWHQAYVIRNNMAMKTPVRFGLTSFEYFEILEGLQEGDEVIISNMETFRRMDEMKVID